MWEKRDTRRAYTVPGNPRFMGPRDAIGLINDGDVMATSGMAGNHRPRIMAWAFRELFEETGHPRDLTVICTAAQGGRGKVPGTLEDLGLPGQCTRMITAHQETFKALLRLVESDDLTMQCLPQGILTFLIEAQARGEFSITGRTGIGTFIDPRVGSGSDLFGPSGDPLITVEGDNLRYSMPPINVGLFGAPAADREGNIYLKNGCIKAEMFEVTRAARANGGKVIANVGQIIEADPEEIAIPAEDVDAIVVDPDAEQALSVKHRKHWSFLTLDSDLPADEAIARVRFLNQLMGITPKRTEADVVLARLAATTFAEHARPGDLANVGVGLPEEVSRMLFAAGAMDDVTLFTESGVIGGIPTPGVFFGAAVCPDRIVPSAEAFRMVHNELDVTILGALEVDSRGNVNVSKRGEGPMNYVGPGGFIDITTGAKTIVFVSSWMANAEVTVANGRVRIARPGPVKFMDQVREVTFSGEQALAQGKTVFYATTVGLFRLTPEGMELVRIMPGIDLKKDILDATSMRVVVPDTGPPPEVPPAVVTGEGFTLRLGAGQSTVPAGQSDH
ncbi:MAG: hypothetical protein GY851_24060 [bacterium]|nr:hypothetical protein [bacterium]